MSQENVELILRVQPAGDVDLVELHRDDEAWAAWIDKFALHAYPEFECVRPSLRQLASARDWIEPERVPFPTGIQGRCVHAARLTSRASLGRPIHDQRFKPTWLGEPPRGPRRPLARTLRAPIGR